jgi:hypothetical protein
MSFKNKCFFPVLAGCLVLVLGCEHAAIKPTEDSKRLQLIDAYIENLRVAFEGRNLQAFSSAYLADRSDDLKTVSAFMDSASSPHLDILIDRIVLQGDAVQVSLHWELRWTSERTGLVKQRGNALFELAGKGDLRLQAIEGDNPFIAPASYRVSQP